MTDLRLKRLLWMAFNGGNCKAFYSQYISLCLEYGDWLLGHFWLNDKGVAKLSELTGEDIYAHRSKE